jgi:hypothetical protein
MVTEWILGRLARVCGVGSTGSEYGHLEDSCEYSDESLGSSATELVISHFRVYYVPRPSSLI